MHISGGSWAEKGGRAWGGSGSGSIYAALYIAGRRRKNFFLVSLCRRSKCASSFCAEANHPRSEDASGRRASNSTLFYEGALLAKEPNRYLPPALKHNSRLNNSVVSRRTFLSNTQTRKKPAFSPSLSFFPARIDVNLKHYILFGSDEWTPSGPGEVSEPAVFGCVQTRMAQSSAAQILCRPRPLPTV